LAGRLQITDWDISRETLAKVESHVRFAEALDVDPSELLKPTKF
jgi:hypothetical protein